MSEQRDFLFELGTEELPPKALLSLSKAFKGFVKEGVEAAGLGYQDIIDYAAPRRLAILIESLQACQADAEVERRGPAVAAAFGTDGQPSKAALGFAASCGVAVNDLERLETDKGAWLVFRSTQQGQTVFELMPAIISKALEQLPIPKRMRWADLKVEFVRPVHWAVMLFGDELVPAEILSVATGRDSRGHRFHHPESITITTPAAYKDLLATPGHVQVDFDARRQRIEGQVQAIAKTRGVLAVIDPDLLEEVTAMVEWPVAVLGGFDEQFLELPPEVLIAAMKGHQKYFHVVDETGALQPYFITVSNIDSRDPAVVQRGNERVIRPRLADAAFFWQQDGKQALIDRVESQRAVVFQQQLGTLYDKTLRVQALAGHIAGQMDIDQGLTERAALLAKCDLMTDMVGEFPELQGIMGRYYALQQGEPKALALALDEAYQPRFAGDAVPASPVGQALSLADKLDTLAGLFAINALPTGTKDPFALRRAALGVLRTIIECGLGELDLQDLITRALAAYPVVVFEQQKKTHQQKIAKDKVKSKSKANTATPTRDHPMVAKELFGFMMDRLRVYYANQQVSPDVFAAVLARRPTRPVDFDARVQAVMSFRRLPEAAALAAAYKRSDNILRKYDGVVPEQVDAALLAEPAEQQLAEQLQRLALEVEPLMQRQDYNAALIALATLRTAVDCFFDEVMVMVDDDPVRDNRLALLQGLRQLLSQVADLSCLQGQD